MAWLSTLVDGDRVLKVLETEAQERGLESRQITFLLAGMACWFLELNSNTELCGLVKEFLCEPPVGSYGFSRKRKISLDVIERWHVFAHSNPLFKEFWTPSAADFFGDFVEKRPCTLFGIPHLKTDLTSSFEMTAVNLN